MKLLLLSLLTLSIFAPIHGWTAIEIVNATEHPGYCDSKNEDVGIMKVGEEKRLKDMCVQASCSQTEISYYGCGAISAGPPCKVVDGNLNKPYPSCCPQIKCETLSVKDLTED